MSDFATSRRVTRIFFFAVYALASTSALAQDINFKDHGKTVLTIGLAKLKSEIPPVEITVFEPQEQKPVTFRALPTAQVLDRVYGPAWKKAEQVLFTCVDGYKPTLPVNDLESQPSFLAFEKVGSSDFSVSETVDHEKDVALGPLYLVWDNLHNDALRAEGAYGWPFQIVTLDLIQFTDQFPKLAPPAHSSTQVKQGFAHFQKYCMQCHSLSGEGGGRGPELSGIVAAKSNSELREWINDPVRIRPSTKMPTLNPKLKGKARTKVIDSIVAYIRSKVGKATH